MLRNAICCATTWGAARSWWPRGRAVLKFSVELAPSGTAGKAPAYARLLRACGMAQSSLTVPSRIEMTPVSTGFESLVFRFNYDGTRYASRGARGKAKLKTPGYKIPLIEFEFHGFDTLAIAEAVPATNYAAYARPPVLSDAVTADLRTGASYAAAVLTGGTPYPSRGLEVDLGNTLNHLKLWGGEAIEITNRSVLGSTTVFLTAAQEVTWRDEVNANTLTSVGFSFGLTAGNRFTLFGPSVQRIDPKVIEDEGRIMLQTELAFLPLATTGNDELRLVFH